MGFCTIIETVVVLCLAVFSACAEAENWNTHIPLAAREADNIGGVYICTDINWGGRCGYAVQPLNTCIVLGSDWNKQISKFGPDPRTSCFIYSNAGCEYTGIESWVINYPGDATGGLTDNPIGGPWNDFIPSFECSQTICP